MFTLRFKDIKAACARAIGTCDDDARVFDAVNEAQERLLYGAKAKGTVQTFRFCVPSSGCIVWPREIETPEGIAVDSVPYKIRSEWYELAENGPGAISCDCDLAKTLIDRGEVPAFDEVTGSSKKLAVFCDRTEGAGKHINLQFYDENGQWVTSTFNGQVIDGENVIIPTTAGTYSYTTAKCKAGGLFRVTKDITLGLVRLYEYDTTNGNLKALAFYQPDEEVPVYRRSLIPSLANAGCDQTKVLVVAKLRFIPARTDESFVMISHRAALRIGCQAVKKEEDNLHAEATLLWAQAFNLLGQQVAHHHGSGLRASIQFASALEWGGGIQAIQ
jgi:hypothetical protein